MSSDPPSSGSLDDGWGIADDPSSEPAAALRAPKLPAISLPEVQGALRDTIPPPIPVALYVKTMMSQVDEDEECAPSSPGPSSWRGEPPLAQPESRAPHTPGRLASELPDAHDGGVLSLRVAVLPDLPITAEIDIGDLVDLVTLDEMDALAREGAEAPTYEEEDAPPSSENPFPGAVVPVPPPEPAPHTLRTPQSDPSASVARRAPSVPDVVLGAPMEPEPLFGDGGGAMIDPTQTLNPYDLTGVVDDHPFSDRAGRIVSEAPPTRPWSSSPPRPQPVRSPGPSVVDPRGSIPPILAAWSVPEAPAAPSEHPPATMKGPFGEPSPVPRRSAVAVPRPDAMAALPRASAAPIQRTAPSLPMRPHAASPSIPAPASPEPTRDYLGEIQERLDVGDDLGAMMLAENLLTVEPDNGEATQCVEICRGRLIDKYLARLGGRRRVPRVVLGMDEIRYLSLDHRAGFLLSNIDGTMTVEEVLDVSGMAEFDALRLLDDFRERGVIDLPEPRRRR
ncbi:MAG: hypothetical protein ABI193_10095 [Minicystis sp.]